MSDIPPVTLSVTITAEDWSHVLALYSWQDRYRTTLNYVKLIVFVFFLAFLSLVLPSTGKTGPQTIRQRMALPENIVMLLIFVVVTIGIGSILLWLRARSYGKIDLIGEQLGFIITEAKVCVLSQSSDIRYDWNSFTGRARTSISSC